jgi:hypothetical protein
MLRGAPPTSEGQRVGARMTMGCQGQAARIAPVMRETVYSQSLPTQLKPIERIPCAHVRNNYAVTWRSAVDDLNQCPRRASVRHGDASQPHAIATDDEHTHRGTGFGAERPFHEQRVW